MSMHIANCSTCDAPIIWTITEAKGNRMPVDADPSEDGKGFVLVEDETNKVVSVWHTKAGDFGAEGQDIHQSHFATCPERDQHRKIRTAGHAHLIVMAVWVCLVVAFGLGMYVRGAVLNGTPAQVEGKRIADVRLAADGELTCSVHIQDAGHPVDSVHAWVHRGGEHPQLLSWRALPSP